MFRFASFPAPAALIGATVLITGLASRPAYAQLFNFEDQAATFVSPPADTRPGALSSLVLNNGGVTLTITRPNAARFDIVDNTTDNQNEKPVSFGARSLDPFFDTADNVVNGTATGNGDNGFIGNFSTAVTNISLDFGDYEGSVRDVDTLTLSAYSGANGTGTLLGTTTVNLGNSGFLNPVAPFPAGFGTAVVSASGIQSFTINGTSSNPGVNNSVFIDNIGVNASAAPEPGSLTLLLGMGVPAVGGLTYRLRRRKK